MDRSPSTTIPLNTAKATTPGMHDANVPVAQPTSLKRVVSGAALKELLASGTSTQSKTPSKIDNVFQNYSHSEISRDAATIKNSVVMHLTATFLRTPANMDSGDAYLASAFSVRDRLLQRWNMTNEYHDRVNAKRVYYMSLEFLIGRTFDNALLALELRNEYSKVLGDVGFCLEDIIDEERDAALGNGGLGRLAACYVDSMACSDYPGWGYGLRYKYGMFQQQIINGYQVEAPDCWLDSPNPWEFPRPDVTYPVKFYGHLVRVPDSKHRFTWESNVVYDAMAFDVPVPGYGTNNVGNIRLWSCKTNSLFDLNKFNAGDYAGATGGQVAAQILTDVLYPNDNTNEGKELRLRQEYLFCSATLQDIVARFKKTGKPLSELPDLAAIQLNDTHPTLGIPELMRILLDDEALTWDEAWSIVTRTFAFTNHTILPEAMEKWPVPMMDKILPRHMGIIYDINLYFLQSVEEKFPGDRDLLRRISIIEESNPQQVRMAFLACVGSHKVNGVAAIHSDIIKQSIFNDFVTVQGEDKFINKTNGVSPRRWMNGCNPDMSALITEVVGDRTWINDLTKIKKLEDHVADDDFRTRWSAAKQKNKQRLADYILSTTGIKISADALFDVQVKRIHEYKRQLMNIFSVIYRYHCLKQMTPTERAKEVSRVVIFAGKAAAGYWVAKQVIKLINSVAEVINADAEIGDVLKVVFIPDYSVTAAEYLIPASDISQHISTAGTEASGTSNMKFVLNGGIILGTVDGANIEIGEEIGEEQIFFFGCLAHEVGDFRHYLRFHQPKPDEALQTAFDLIQNNTFGDGAIFQPLIDSVLRGGDVYLLSVDFPSYIQAHKAVEDAYRNQEEWVTKSILSVARMAKFSSDRSIQEYAEEVWNIEPVRVTN
ncbi:glycosyl transferase [Kickxella alabastrina]|uniref:glycosyl transferase n=1 Tax=Kickxella alabastrina TaxID=61397 RepID=UPI00221E7720|nr:glycosyl transferase [Kickxella alabastrina]KAI7823904.1 glycosyl transferase [Kickxella alabastrina]